MDVKLTAGEIRAMRVILATGGNVRLTMGRLGPADVRTVIVNSLLERRLVAVWTNSRIRHLQGGAVNLCVTAQGCQALPQE